MPVAYPGAHIHVPSRAPLGRFSRPKRPIQKDLKLVLEELPLKSRLNLTIVYFTQIELLVIPDLQFPIVGFHRFRLIFKLQHLVGPLEMETPQIWMRYIIYIVAKFSLMQATPFGELH